MAEIAAVQLVVGLEIHVELSTRTKMFSRAPNPAAAVAEPEGAVGAWGRRGRELEPNTLIDPVVLGLPGALPVMNKAAVELSMMVGMALGCSIAEVSKWDRKSYFYPDLPKNYQISQYPLPLCFDGCVELPVIGADGKIDWDRTVAEGGVGVAGKRIGIIRAHLEEDAGKLLHEAPGGGAIDHSLVDWNRAGTPLLEIVTQPDFSTADEVVVFAQMLRNICRFLGASEGVMQKGHMRFEPNINCILTLADGRTVKTPVVEVKNLNSFKSVRGAIEYELREQPKRWREDGQVCGPGSKSTRGWDDAAQTTFLQRSKEDAHDYRYFPDPDLPPVVVDAAWRERVRGRVTELPLTRARRFIGAYGLSPKEAAAITDERDVCLLYEQTIDAAVQMGVDRASAARKAANFILQSGAKRANERSAALAKHAQEEGRTPPEPVLVSDLGITAAQIAGIVKLREEGAIGSNAADELFGALCTKFEHADEAIEHEPAGADPAEVARRRGMIIVRDEAALVKWCEQAIADNTKSAEDVRAGKVQALGRLVGAAMKASGGQGDAAAIRAKLAEMLGVKL